jgi:hypothetical protein
MGGEQRLTTRLLSITQALRGQLVKSRMLLHTLKYEYITAKEDCLLIILVFICFMYHKSVFRPNIFH